MAADSARPAQTTSFNAYRKVMGLSVVTCAKTAQPGGLILKIYTSYDLFFFKELPFRAAMIAPALTF